MKVIETTIKIKSNEDFIRSVVSLLEHCQHCGDIGHTTFVALEVDGDGSDRPRVETDFWLERGKITTDGIITFPDGYSSTVVAAWKTKRQI